MSSRELTEYERKTYFPIIKKELDKSKTDKEIENALNDYMENVVEKNPENYEIDKNLTETIVSAVVSKLTSSGGRRRRRSSKKQSARRRRSSKARNSRKARKSRTTRRR